MPRGKVRLTHDQFILKLNEKFPVRDYEIVGEYTFNKHPILVRGEYGMCLIKPNQLVNGGKPSIKNAIDKYRYTVNRFNSVHKGRYIYPEFKYTGAKQKIPIVCKVHGEFSQSINDHYNGTGCVKCKNDATRERESMSEEDFIRKSSSVHNNKYDYSKTKYTGCREKVVITCPEHGDFKQVPYYHLAGNGCQICSKELGGFGRTDYIKLAKGRQCVLYIIECSIEEEYFIKVGITYKTIKKRFYGKYRMPYNYKILKEIKGDAGSIWDLELEYKRRFTDNKYSPKLKFKGETECFNINIKQDILDF